MIKGASCALNWRVCPSFVQKQTHAFANPVRVCTAFRPATSLRSISAASTKSENQSFSDYIKWPLGGGNVHVNAQVDSTAIVAPSAVIEEGAQVKKHAHIGPGSVVGENVIIGANTRLWFNVSIQNCTVGENCVFHSGVCIGQDGFGFTVNEVGKMVKKPQTLNVRIGNEVEIGANSCVDRGSWRDTVIGDSCKIDNLVQIGHNVVLGKNCLLCGQVGIGGSCTIGDYVVFGGQSGAADHVTIASKVRVAAKSGVISDLTESGDYGGFPAVPAKEWRRSVALQRRQAKHSIKEQ